MFVYTQAKSKEARTSGLLLFCRHALNQQAALLLPLVRASHQHAAAATSSNPVDEATYLDTWCDLDSQCHVRNMR